MAATFYARAAPAVIAATRGTVLFPSVVLAQLTLESNSGKSELSAKYHNYLGHKAFSSWKGRTVTFSTPNDAVKRSAFRVYGSLLECLRAHVAILTGPLYRAAQQAQTPYAQVNAMARTYAEDPRYAEKLTSIMRSHNLTQYDVAGAAQLLPLALLTAAGAAAAYRFRGELHAAVQSLTSALKF